MPTGPTVMVLPAPGKPFEVFMADDALCKQWAQSQIGGANPSETAQQNTATGAVVGTLVGAAIGTAIGAATGNTGAAVGTGAAIGGGAGLLGGMAVGSNQGYNNEYQLQRRYDMAYVQCMYAKGNQVPGSAQRTTQYYPAPPPPPSGAAPAPAQGAWVTVPGQYVNGKWVPEHKIYIPSGNGQQGAVPGQPPPQSGPYSSPPPR